MIKTLYVRVVLTFLGIVVISLFASFFISKQLYGNRITNHIRQHTNEVGKQIIQYCTENQIQDVQGYLDSLTTFTPYKLSLFRENGTAANPNPSIRREDVDKVLQGGIYRSYDEPGLRYHMETMIGLPFTVRGESYALFIEPDIRSLLKDFDVVVLTVLVVSLLIGSAHIVIASRYLVKPLKTLTRATKKIVAGDYNVEVQVKNKDELGVLASSFNQMVKELRQIEQMRQDFVSDVSHEIQSPLTSIRGFSATLRQDDLPEADRKRYLSIIAAESERLSRLSEDLLKLASLDSEHHPFAPATYRLDEQLRRAVIVAEPLWSRKHLDIDLSLEGMFITADEDQLAQVWTNLIGNSIKFTPPGGRISIELIKQDREVSVRIADSGIGIAEEEVESIFRRFYKADKARERSHGGSGLGLAIVQKIVALHQGRIDVESKLDHGTAITVTLPDHEL